MHKNSCIDNILNSNNWLQILHFRKSLECCSYPQGLHVSGLYQRLGIQHGTRPILCSEVVIRYHQDPTLFSTPAAPQEFMYNLLPIHLETTTVRDVKTPKKLPGSCFGLSHRRECSFVWTMEENFEGSILTACANVMSMRARNKPNAFLPS